MDSPATSPKLQFLDVDGGPIEGPLEWTPALLAVEMDSSQWDSANLLVQETPLPLMLRRVGGQPKIVAEWPRSGPGRYAVRVLSPSGEAALTVVIRPAKLSESAYVRLLDDLENRLPAAVAIGLQRAGGLGGLAILPPAETTVSQEMARLHRTVWGTDQRPGLVRVLHVLAADPHHMLRSTPFWVPRERARRPHPADLAYAVTRPHNLASDDQPIRVIDRRAEPTVDLYENRLVRLFVDEVQVRLRRLVRRAVASGSSTAQKDVQSMQEGMRRARRAAIFLDSVTQVTHLPSQITMVLLNRPAYRAALEGYLELHRSLAIRVEDPRLDAPLENLPALYQLWGTMEVITLLLEVAVEHGYRLSAQELVHRDAAGAFVRIVPGGRVALRLRHPEFGTDVRLIPEQSFGNTGTFRSVSYTQRPDITVDVRRPGERARLYLFDPKYKLASAVEGQDLPTDGRPSKVDIDKMHTYRDAIRDDLERRVVVSAATMYPGPSERYGQGIEAIQANPDHKDVLRERISDILEEALDTSREHQNE